MSHGEGSTLDAYSLALSQAKCKAKRRFGTGQLALNAGWLLSFKYKTRYAVYPCEWCKQFHLSTQVGRPTALVCML